MVYCIYLRLQCGKGGDNQGIASLVPLRLGFPTSLVASRRPSRIRRGSFKDYWPAFNRTLYLQFPAITGSDCEQHTSLFLQLLLTPFLDRVPGWWQTFRTTLQDDCGLRPVGLHLGYRMDPQTLA